MRPMQRPTFNVTEFQDVVNVQMNDAMRHLLVEFISEVEQHELEPELRAFRNALRDPEGALERKLRSGSGMRRRGYRDDRRHDDYPRQDRSFEDQEHRGDFGRQDEEQGQQMSD
jgi:hypothetical protein